MNSAFGIAKRSLSSTATMNAIKNVTVVGGGLMGSGIAQVSHCHNLGIFSKSITSEWLCYIVPLTEYSIIHSTIVHYLIETFLFYS